MRDNKQSGQLEFLFASQMPESPPSPAPQAEAVPPAPPRQEDRALLKARADELHRELMEKTGCRIRLTITDNSSSIITSRTAPDGLVRLNVHHMFLDAPPAVRKALGQWIKSPRSKKAGDLVNAFIRESKHRIKPKRPRTIRLHTKGRVHDLREMYDEVNAECFENRIEAYIGWGKMPAKMPRRSIRFGSYTHEDRIIRIHPLLDQEYVPRYFVKFVVFHEMLHADMGISENENGRRSIHPPEFRRREKAYHDYERATAWENNRENLLRIFSSRKRPKRSAG